MAGKGLLLDFGGVLTPSLYGRMADFCVSAGLPAEAITEALRTPEGLITGEPGQLAEIERLLGLPITEGAATEGGPPRCCRAFPSAISRSP